MTSHLDQLKRQFKATGLAFLGISFERAMEIPAIRISLECAVKAKTKGKPAPIQPALI